MKKSKNSKIESRPSGKLDLRKLGKLVNKKAGQEVAFNLKDSNPTAVPYWIPTSSRWLDSIILKGGMGGIPATKVSEIAGLSECVTEDTLIEVFVEENLIEATKLIKISEVKELLNKNKQIKVKTLGGEYTSITKYIEKGILPTYEVTLENGRKIKTSKKHLFFSTVGWISTNELKPKVSQLLCDNGKYSKVNKLEYIGNYPIVDITVEHPEHCYYGNGILNHNSGKSYLAAEIGINAQNLDTDVVYFDSENAIDPDFLESKGCDLERLLYIQAINVEFVLETIENIIGAKEKDQKILFIWDSLALTTCIADQEGDMNPNSSIGVKARILSKGIAKLQIPMANSNCTLLVLNQLKDNISLNKYETMANPYFTPGGKTLPYSYSLRIWLTRPGSKKHHVFDDSDKQIGSKVRAKIKKSRFGSLNRECEFDILWGGLENRVCDEESWIHAIKTSPYYSGGAWKSIEYADGTVEKFQESGWLKKLQNEKFRARVLEIMDEELIYKYAKGELNESNLSEEDIEEEE